jgi:hypothetical protein
VLKNLFSYVAFSFTAVDNNVTEVVVTLQNTAHEFLKKSSKTKMLTLLDEDSMVTMTTKSKQVIDLLEGCEILLSSVSTAVKEKATYEKRFFNTSSLALTTQQFLELRLCPC